MRCRGIAAMMFSSAHEIHWIQALLGAEGMASMERMHGGQEQQIDHLREEYGFNFMMFYFYVYNNVSIGFRIFACGMAAGLGTIFFLLFNGLHPGAAAGYVNHACDPESFWNFVSGHSSFKLLGMVISGMAGMRLCLAILRPGRLPRTRALVDASKQAMLLICGAAMLTALAAVIEGFWSAQPVAPELKYAVGIAGWFFLTAYFLMAGTSYCSSRRRTRRPMIGPAGIRRRWWRRRCATCWSGRASGLTNAAVPARGASGLLATCSKWTRVRNVLCRRTLAGQVSLHRWSIAPDASRCSPMAGFSATAASLKTIVRHFEALCGIIEGVPAPRG